MKKFYVNFLLKKDYLEVCILEDITSQYVPVYDHRYDYRANEFAFDKLIEIIKKYVKSKLATKKADQVYYSLIVDDRLYKSFKFVNLVSEYELQENLVTQDTHKQYLHDIAQDQNSANYYLMNEKSFLYEVVNNDETKKYSQFPLNKTGQKLIVHKGLIAFNRKEAFLTKIIESFQNQNIKLQQVLLESQSLIATQDPKDTYSLMVNFDWTSVILNGFFNSKNFYYARKNCNIQEITKYFSEELKLSKEKIDFYCNAVLSNWKYYSESKLSLNNTEEKVFKLLQQAINQVVLKVADIVQNELSIKNIEIILQGRNVDFLLARFQAMCPKLNVTIYDEQEALLSNVRSTFLGTAYLASSFNPRKENLINTLNDLEDYKPRNIFSRFFNWLIKPKHTVKEKY